MMRGSGSSRRYCFSRHATSWTLASEGMEGLPESRVACVCKGNENHCVKCVCVCVCVCLGGGGGGGTITYLQSFLPCHRASLPKNALPC